MFNKILIANRGEIAVRIIRTCKRLGIGTVAVYSDADNRSLHVQLADEAVYIGGSNSQESYLNIEKILSAAVSTDCSAIHPGYGFLSESQQFARAVDVSGLVFVGPPASAISLMGDKIAAKEIAIKAGVPVIPGHVDVLNTVDEALTVAGSIGYPVLLKPAAGGGGKGMRVVFKAEEMEAALASCRQETNKAFGDSRIFMERYIERPRHVEIQILADAQGNIIHLGERECSIQRRYQKIIEESPSPAISDNLRQRMGLAACNLARKAKYENAGTIEFILDQNNDFFFLEMNTRLQVEHPVTELVTGLDILELQLQIAAGQPLPFDQDTVRFSGWAMEARICAENPARNFIPDTGMITRYAEPWGKGIRVDSGIKTGSKVGVYYDSLLAKVISFGKDRDEARTRLLDALNGYHIEGVTTNINFVSRILSHPEFVTGLLDTDFIDRHFEADQPRHSSEPERLRYAALAAILIYHARWLAHRESMQPMVSRIGTKKDSSGVYTYFVRSGGEILQVELDSPQKGRTWTFTVGEHRYTVEAPEFEFYRRRLRLRIDGRTHRFRIRVDPFHYFVAYSGIAQIFEIYTPKEWHLMKYMPRREDRPEDKTLICPMPGLVVAVLAKKGERVFKGQSLVVLESMKMESGVPSPIDGVIADIKIVVNQPVEAGEVLIKFQEGREK